MKALYILLAALLLAGCASLKQSGPPEDALFITRRYVGDYVGNELLVPPRWNTVPVLLVRTTSPEFDTLTIYARDCTFATGERLYVRLTQLRDAWVYELEGREASYRMSSMGFGSKLMTQTWY